MMPPDWLIKCKNAALRCKELDTDKEYAEGNNTILSFVGNEYYKKAIATFNQQNWDEAMALCDESIKIFNECGKKEYASESYLLAGKAAFNSHNNEAILKYLKPLVRSRSKDQFVYRTLFDIYKSTADTNEAVTHPSTSPWFAWPSLGTCVTPWSTVRVTSALSTATALPPCVTQSAAWSRSPTK